jgi:hypothetical protein
MGTEHDNAAIVRRFWDLVWNKGELPAIDELVDDDFTNRGPAAVGPVCGCGRCCMPRPCSAAGSADHAIVLPRRRLPPPRRPPARES